MPKKFVGENSKAVAARARKGASKEADVAKKQKQVEDALWMDDDKHITKKLQRKEENEKKKQQLLDKKAEAKALLDKENDDLKPMTKQAAPRITRAQIQIDAVKRNSALLSTTKLKPVIKTHIDEPIEENMNRFEPDEIANTVDEALAMLCVNENGGGSDKHPEKRLKAAYTAYEQKYMPILKQEHPSLRLSQLKQMLFKDWAKSTENPLNQV